MTDYRINGEIWLDTDGNVIHAHGGCIQKYGDYFYWYGENRTEKNYVSCYRSTDLINWEFRNNILTSESETEKIRVRTDLKLINEGGRKVNIERPKVIYNQLTGKYVMWAHYENGIDYLCAAACIASCDTPDGDFTYHGSFNPYGYMSRDCTLYEDESGDVYFISAARDNADLHIYRLAEDFMNVESIQAQIWQGEYREAPAIFKKGNLYYMLSSFCTGWHPNQGKFGISDKIEGRWSMLKNFGDETTFRTQPAYVFKTEDRYIYISDRWDAKDYNNSRYVFLNLKFNREDNESVYIEYENIFK